MLAAVMVALAEWIESEESAVADARPHLGEADPHPKNRVRRFFPDSPDRVGETPPQVVDRVGVLLVVEVRPRRAPSLARSRQLDHIDELNVAASDEAMKLPGTREKYWAIIERVDKKTGETFYERMIVNAGATEVTAADIDRAYGQLSVDTRYELRMGRARTVSEGHTHPTNSGASSRDVDRSIQLGNQGVRSYLRTPNGNVYRITTETPYSRWDRAFEWLYVDRDKYQEQIR